MIGVQEGLEVGAGIWSISINNKNLSQNAKRASARKDTGLDQSLFSVHLFRLRINIMKVCKGSI